METINRRIVLFGCQRMATDVIRFIDKYSGIIGTTPEGKIVTADIVGVVTHDEERDRMFSAMSVAEYCDSLGIFNFRYDGKVNADPIKDLKPDIIFSIYYRKILPKEIIDLPTLGCINLHPALLPKDRGPNPTYWQVRRGDDQGGSTLHYINEGMDTGDIISQSNVVFIKDMSGFQLIKWSLS